MEKFFSDTAWRWAIEVDNWLGVALFSFLLGIVFCTLVRAYNDPRRLERAMSKKAEQDKIAGIVEVALDTAMRQEHITPAQYKKYSARLGRAMNIPHLIPVHKPRIIHLPNGNVMSIPKVFLLKTKEQVLRRLHKAGVDVAGKLSFMKKERDRQKRVTQGLKPIKKA